MTDATHTNTWDYEGYWNAVLGANRDAADVIREFGLAISGLDEWLGGAEADAWASGNRGCDLPEEWTGFHARALAELTAAIEGSGNSVYTYTIYDANPHEVSGSAWTSHRDVGVEAESDTEALDHVRDVLSTEAVGLSTDYEVGQRLYALVWDADTTLVGTPTYELTAEDLGVDKGSVSDRDWESVASYVSTFPNGDEDGACDVDVQVGEAGGVWFLRTKDDAGGSDEADDTAYDTREEVEAAAEAFAAEHTEANEGEDAEDYLRRKREEAAGEPDDEGEFCVYWDTALDDSGPRERYATAEQAEAAAALANEDLHRTHPGGNLLCGFGARALVDGEWVAIEGES